MKRNVLIISVLFILLVSACGSQATPTANPADIQATSQAAAFTMVAQTQQAIPTPTQVPPTEIPSETPLPSVTPIPLTTQVDGTQQVVPTQAGITQPGLPTSAVAVPSGLSPTFTPQSLQPNPSSGNSQDVCNQPLTSWQGPTAKFSIQNQTKPQGTIVLSMYVVTEMNQCGYLVISGDSFSGPVGQYSAGAFITGKQNMKAFGSFRITEGSWSIVVRNDSILAKGGCSPNC
jgi:hypothetical protein